MITVTGATGHLGRLVVTGLLDAGVPAGDVTAGDVTAVVRSPERATDLADRGVVVRRGDHADRASLDAALAGTDRLLLVSGTEVGRRVAPHHAVLDAAVDAGVGLVAYTSAPRADDTPLVLAPEHAATEELIAVSGLPAVLLRNNWYLENHDQQIAQAAATHSLVGSAGDGRVWAAAREDFAAAAVAVLSADRPPTWVLELGGDTSFTMADLAATVAEQTGTEVTYTDLPVADHVQVLVDAGLDEDTASFVAAIDDGIRQGALDVGAHGISALTGRPTRTLAEHVAAVLAR